MVVWWWFAGCCAEAGSAVSVALSLAVPLEGLRDRVARMAFLRGFAFVALVPVVDFAAFPRAALPDRGVAWEATARRLGFEPRDDFAFAVLDALRDGIRQLA
jgi:hypothetical protein